MATHIFSPHNEFGKALVPVGMQKTKAKVSETEFIDISWLDTVNDYEQGKAEADSKIVLYPALEGAVQYTLKNSITRFKFKVLEEGETALPQQITEENIKELQTTIYLVAVPESAEEKNKYVEFVCSNTEEYDEELKTPVEAKYEQLGSINYILEQATGETLGGVKLLDTSDETKGADSGYAATPKAIHTLQQQIENKKTTFTLNDKTVTEGTAVKIEGTAPIQVATADADGVAITVSVQDASEETKGVAKLYASAETGSQAEDGPLTAKATAEEIKKVEDKVTALQIPEVVTEEKTITNGQVTLEGTNIVVVSVFLETGMFIPQVEQTEGNCVLTFFTEESEHYNDGTQATINYIKKPTA